jgi:hypothetical protein
MVYLDTGFLPQATSLRRNPFIAIAYGSKKRLVVYASCGKHINLLFSAPAL